MSARAHMAQSQERVSTEPGLLQEGSKKKLDSTIIPAKACCDSCWLLTITGQANFVKIEKVLDARLTARQASLSGYTQKGQTFLLWYQQGTQHALNSFCQRNLPATSWSWTVFPHSTKKQPFVTRESLLQQHRQVTGIQRRTIVSKAQVHVAEKIVALPALPVKRKIQAPSRAHKPRRRPKVNTLHSEACKQPARGNKKRCGQWGINQGPGLSLTPEARHVHLSYDSEAIRNDLVMNGWAHVRLVPAWAIKHLEGFVRKHTSEAHISSR